jgi:hypothetical protein
MWNIFYDPLLVKLSTLNNGYVLKRSPSQPITIANVQQEPPPEPLTMSTCDLLTVPENILVNNVAFRDDLALIAESSNDLKIHLIEAESFLDLRGICLNASKTVL